MAKMKELYTMIQSGDYADFKSKYELAVAEGVEEFIYDNQRVLTSYAKYKVEFVELFLKDLTNDNIRTEQSQHMSNIQDWMHN